MTCGIELWQSDGTTTLTSGDTLASNLTQDVPPLDPNNFNYHLTVVNSVSGVTLAGDSFPFTISASAMGLTASEADDNSWVFHDEIVASPIHQPEAAVPEKSGLIGNYPNPFNPTTTISYHLEEAQRVHIVIFDLTGRRIGELINSVQSPGRQSIQWDGKDADGNPVASGIYFYRLQADGVFIETRKMLLAK